MRKIIFVITIVMIFAGAGCKKWNVEDSGHKRNQMDMKEFEEDLTIPTILWTALEKVYMPLALDPEGQVIKGEMKKKGNENEVEKMLKKRPPIDNLPFKVLLTEKTPGVLGGQNYELKYLPGGGIMDYRYFVPESKDGTFYLKVEYGSEMDRKLTKVFYLSNSKTRMVDGKPMGSGCGRYFDISDFWKRSMDDKGLVLNTVDLRHISVTAGTLFFVAPMQGKLRMGHLTIRDTRHRDVLCGLESKN